MGQLLDDYLDRYVNGKRTVVVDHLNDLIDRIKHGEFPVLQSKKGEETTPLDRYRQFTSLEETVRLSLGMDVAKEAAKAVTPLSEFVDIEVGETWGSILDDFERVQNSRGPGWKVTVTREVRELTPQVRPGVWKIQKWSNVGRDDDVPRAHVAKHFLDAGGFEGWLAPCVKWITAHSTGRIGTVAQAPLGGDYLPEAELRFSDDHSAILRVARPDVYMHNGAICAPSDGLYIGAKFIE